MALKELRDTNTVMVGDLNTPLSPVDRSSRQKISKEISELLHTLDQIDVVTSSYHQQISNTHSFLQLIELSPKWIIF
jgi:hypothetical protein